MHTSRPSRLFHVYSRTRGLYLSIAIGILGLIGAIYLGINQYGASAILTTPGLLFLAMIYGIYDYWRRPLRRAAFYDDRFEITGHKVNIDTNYGEMENLGKVKNLTGSNKHSVTFSVRNSPFEFRIPYRATAALPDLYSSLVEKTHAGKIPSVGEFLLEKEPKSDEEKTLLVAYYLDKFHSLEHFTAVDLEKGFLDAGEDVPKNLEAKIQWNIRRRFMFESGKSNPVSYFISTSGKTRVEPIDSHIPRSKFVGSIGIYLLGILLTFLLFGYNVNVGTYFLILAWILGGGFVLSWFLWLRREG